MKTLISDTGWSGKLF